MSYDLVCFSYLVEKLPNSPRTKLLYSQLIKDYEVNKMQLVFV